jgi:hypothetical protein
VKRARFIAPARREFLSEVAYYNGREPELGARFAAAVGEATTRAVAFPLAGSPASQNTRRVFVKDFPFALIYRPDSDGIVIFAVAMGTTFVSAERGSNAPGFWMRDAMLELWLRFLALHIEDPATPGTLATTIRDRWLLASRGYFTGCVPVALDEAVATDEGRELVRNAVQSLLESLSKGPSHLSAGTLNLMGFSGGPFIGDIEARRLVEAGRAFLDLLDGKITDGPGSTSFMPGCR